MWLFREGIEKECDQYWDRIYFINHKSADFLFEKKNVKGKNNSV